MDFHESTVEIHGTRGAPLNDYIPDLQKKDFFRGCLWGGGGGKTNGTSVFISSMAMIFIFDCAQNDLLEKSYASFMIKS